MTHRRFWLHRRTTAPGGGETGMIAEGVEFTDGSVSLRWPGHHPATTVWDSIHQLLAVHGHGGSTVVQWIDPLPAAAGGDLTRAAASLTAAWERHDDPTAPGPDPGRR
jgi:hypothetical protein